MSSSLDIVTIGDAIAVLDYLHRRELLCQRCGDKLVEFRNQFHGHCGECRRARPNTIYEVARVPNELETRICDALNRWNAQNPPAEKRESAGDPSYPEGTR
jgi:NMD protein affecting ribosome stability and mRNA decay